MNVEEFREFCLSKPGVTEGFPFGGDTLVFKVMNKMFALTGIDEYAFVNLKCDPEYAQELRAKYKGIQPGYHMHKQQWNSVFVDADVPEKLFIHLINHSYDLIVSKLPKKDREALKNLT